VELSAGEGAGALTTAARVLSPSRLAEVRRTGLLDTPREEAFDRFARLAAVTLGRVTAFVTIVDERRSFWKACIAADGSTLEARENTVDESFCQYVIGQDGPVVITDARTDPLTSANPSVTSMGVVAWAGYPVRTPDGQVLGTFCVVGDQPRDWTAAELQTLETLAHAVSGEVALRVAVEEARAAVRAAETTARRSSALLGALQDAFFVVDPAGRTVEVNDAFGDVLGYGPEGLPYLPPHPWWPDPDTDPEAHAQLLRDQETAFATGGRFLVRLRHRDGHRVWVEASASSVADPDGGGPMVVGVLHDVTQQHRAARHDRLLADTGELLVRPAALQERLDRFTALAAPVLADTALVSLTRPNGRLAPIAAASTTAPDAAAALLALAPYVIPEQLRAEYSSGRAFVVHPVTDELIAASSPDGDDVAARRAVHLLTSLVVPLVVDGHLLGTLTFGSTTAPRTHDAVDLALAEELGRRVAGMVQADQIATRERQLQALTTALAAAATVPDAASALLDGMSAMLGTDRAAAFVVRPDDPAHLHLVHQTGYPAAVEAVLGVLPLTDALPVAHAALDHTPVWLPDQRAWLDRYPQLAEAMECIGVVPADVGRAVAALPLLVEDGLVGAVALGFPTDRTFLPDERASITTVVNLAAQALDRTIAADTRRDIADTLQRGLLPTHLPSVPQLALAARYLPAGVHTAAGGDWFDVTVLDDDHVAIAVGDVVGQGSRAAAVMGQLRSALAAYLLEGRSPAHAITWLSRFARDIEGARGSTAVCLVLHTGTGALSWARAGHLPPLVLDPAGGARFLDDAHGPVLGLAADLPITEGRTRLEPGCTVLLYTDGLVERRTEDVDDGLDRLAEACRTDRTPGPLIQQVLDRTLDGDRPADDVALVAARLLPGPLTERLPARPDRLRPLRRAISRWSAAAGLPEEQTDDLQLAVVELVSNAVEHAYRDGEPGEVGYRLDRTASGAVHIEITDDGLWRPPTEPGYRGRGLLLVDELSTDLLVHHGPDGRGTTVRTTVPVPDQPSSEL
jgi:PAS domain S-box-containing protein